MKRFYQYSLIAILIALIPLLINNQLATATTQAADEARWMRWGNAHYDIADDDDVVWVGTASGIIRWHKLNESYERYGAADGIPHRNVFAVAVDGDGNRWFGGDAGLSKLDTNNFWTHYNSANSDLASDRVRHIAVTAGGAIYLGHGDPNGIVTRIAGKQWTSYESRQAAVEAHSAEILQTTTQTALWAVRLNEIWVDYNVWDGIAWQQNKPESVPDVPVDMMGSKDGKLWTLGRYYGDVYSWDGTVWEAYSTQGWWHGGATALTVLNDNSVWIGQFTDDHLGHPYGNPEPSLAKLSGSSNVTANTSVLRFYSVPFTSLLETPEGLWGIGNQWLSTPEKHVPITDGFEHPTLQKIVKDTQNQLYLTSVRFFGGSSSPWASSGTLQRIDDNQTIALSDDIWPRALDRAIDDVNAIAAAANSGLWISETSYDQRANSVTSSFIRARNGQNERFNLPLDNSYGARVVDISVIDEEWVWLAAVREPNSGLPDSYIIGLNTIDPEGKSIVFTAGTSDDSRQVAVAKNGTVWFGDNSGLYRRVGSVWEQVSGQAVSELVAGSDGSIVAVDYAANVLSVAPNGQQTTTSIHNYTLANRALIATFSENDIWEMGVNNDIWFWNKGNALSILSNDEVSNVQLPQSPIWLNLGGSSWVVDDAGRAWFATGSGLWRFDNMSGQPTFELSDSSIFMTPDEQTRSGVNVLRQFNFPETVSLTVSDLPAGITATVSADSIIPPYPAHLTVTTSPSTTVGTYSIELTATSATVEDTATITVRVIDEVFRSYLPVTNKP